MSSLLLPGQPIPLAPGAGASAQHGAGTYTRDGVLRASLVGQVENIGGVTSVALLAPARSLNSFSRR